MNENAREIYHTTISDLQLLPATAICVLPLLIARAFAWPSWHILMDTVFDSGIAAKECCLLEQLIGANTKALLMRV